MSETKKIKHVYLFKDAFGTETIYIRLAKACRHLLEISGEKYEIRDKLRIRKIIKDNNFYIQGENENKLTIMKLRLIY